MPITLILKKEHCFSIITKLQYKSLSKEADLKQTIITYKCHLINKEILKKYVN
jgi:hypothetical protein